LFCKSSDVAVQLLLYIGILSFLFSDKQIDITDILLLGMSHFFLVMDNISSPL